MHTRFTRLNQLLSEHQAYWRFEPFHESRHLAHRFADTELGEWLDALSSGQIEVFKSDVSHLYQALRPFLPVAAELETLCQLQRQKECSLGLDAHLISGIPGRKLTQNEALGSHALQHHQGGEWLEWCAGKGFLGRILAAESTQVVTSFEWQQALCDHGQHAADQQQLPVQFVQGDAFHCDHDKVFNPNQHAVALHACGDLHVVLMQHAAQHGLPAMTIAPCCYHLIQNDRYQPLSVPGQNSELALSRSELRIPLQETVTGGERVVRHRFAEMSFRLGLDDLLRDAGWKDYVPVPSVKKSQLQAGFRAFCEWAAAKKGFTLPEVDFTHYQRQGEARFCRMEKLSLIQQLFHRPLEMWLILDKALYLQEQGYQVGLSEFCDKKITPRNIVISAALSSVSD